MTISIDIGKAYINGYYYENTTKLVKTIDVADGVLNRIDLVVLRLDFTNREIKTYVKKVELCVAQGDKAAANEALTAAISEISKACSKGIYHKNTAARKVSRLTKAVNAMA